MKITGFKIRERLSELELQLKVLYGQFEDSLKKFEGEDKKSPIDISAKILKTETDIAQLQSLQARINSTVMVTVDSDGGTVSLLQAVKMVGSAGRIEKMWRKVAAPTKDRYDRDDVRDSTNVYAKKTVSTEAAAEQAMKAAHRAVLIRSAIAFGNSVEVDLNIDPGLFR